MVAIIIFNCRAAETYIQTQSLCHCCGQRADRREIRAHGTWPMWTGFKQLFCPPQEHCSHICFPVLSNQGWKSVRHKSGARLVSSSVAKKKEDSSIYNQKGMCKRTLMGSKMCSNTTSELPFYQFPIYLLICLGLESFSMHLLVFTTLSLKNSKPHTPWHCGPIWVIIIYWQWEMC